MVDTSQENIIAICRGQLRAQLNAEPEDLTRALREAFRWAAWIREQPISPRRTRAGSIAHYDGEGALRVFGEIAQPLIAVLSFAFREAGEALEAATAIDPAEVLQQNRCLVLPRARRFRELCARPVADYDILSGWAAVQLTAAVRADAGMVRVEDASVLRPGRGYQLRRETVTLDPSWRPPAWTGVPVPGVVPLVAPLTEGHPEGTILTDVPPVVPEALIDYARALLTNWALTRELELADPDPDTALNTGTRYLHPREVAARLVDQAEQRLRRTVHEP
ncbi:hypothetical protein C5N14_27420 [Micromonospora sp. MW-13]|uniref:hypothetical protein n=1 Tax=Micromonospora sp. MW-13 TaxID=2094022 RepID=UPI000E43177F|nr:hypothetical protein [Micromonospora sp. MW-13]RGC65635.1 hypothetical protein C5N14_27420 [Micromonospora sp. MW-13]